jgi:hypothetical protein
MENPPPLAGGQDAENLNLLAVFHYVVAGIGFLFACIPVLHLVMGIVMIIASSTATGQNAAAAVPAGIGYLFTIVAAFFILLGWTAAACTAISGRLIAQRRHRQFSFVMGAILCAFMPFGTVLGVFTIILLNKASVKEIYARAA